MTRPRRRPQSNLLTLALSVALAVTVGFILYLAVTSLPYLAASPTSDPTFGALNQCLLSNAPQRVGFAVARDARRAAVWTTEEVVECAEADDGATARTWRLPGATMGAYDGRGRLWVAARGADAGLSGLFVLEEGTSRPVGELTPRALAGTRDGVVALEPTGRVVSLDAEGHLTGVRDLPSAQGAVVTSSADGLRVAVLVGGGLYALDALTLAVLRAEAPCQVERLWWTKGGHRVLLSCGPGQSWALWVDVDSGQTDTAPARARVDSVLAGPDGPWVQACDVLPCTAEEP
ncbi:MAG: hypothetical protein IT380_19575 [Myxococcales bacterium]|nr:hypothetical protein [Myxococcales bacterium]